MRTELWVRDDDWSVSLTVSGNIVLKASGIPVTKNWPPPKPLTYGYMVMAMEAHGYELKERVNDLD